MDRNVGLIPRLNSKGEDIMVRDLLLLLAVSIVLSVFIWSIFGNWKTRPGHPRGEASHSLNAAADLFD